MPGMDEEPGSVFQDMRALFEKLGVKVCDESSPMGDAVDAGIGESGGEEQDKKNESSSKGSWRDRHLREEEAPPPSQQPKTWREPRAGSSSDEPKDGSLSYDERAAQHKAVRTQQGTEPSAPPERKAPSDNGSEKNSLTEKAPEAASYEERAALRRAERDRRMKEREALATAK